MLDLDYIPSLNWQYTTKGDTSSKALGNISRENAKILMDAQDRQYDYTTKRNRVGWTFESLFRSIGLAGGVLVGGPIGAATMGAIGSGVGRGLGENIGNRIYGQTMFELDNVIQDYKYRQLSNNYVMGMNTGVVQMNDEIYAQTYKSYTDVADDLGQQIGS